MRIKAKTNLDQCFAQLDAFVDRVEQVAEVRAINKLAQQAQTAGFREIARIYDIGPRRMETYASVRLAGPQLEASINVKGRGFPLSEFAPIKTSKGISVRIKGKRLLIPHSFFIPAAKGHVFARGGYGNKRAKVATGESFGRFGFGKQRLPIAELYSFGPVEAFTNEQVVTTMQDRVEQQAKSVLAQEIRFAARA